MLRNEAIATIIKEVILNVNLEKKFRDEDPRYGIIIETIENCTRKYNFLDNSVFGNQGLLETKIKFGEEVKEFLASYKELKQRISKFGEKNKDKWRLELNACMMELADVFLASSTVLVKASQEYCSGNGPVKITGSPFEEFKNDFVEDIITNEELAESMFDTLDYACLLLRDKDIKLTAVASIFKLVSLMKSKLDEFVFAYETMNELMFAKACEFHDNDKDDFMRLCMMHITLEDIKTSPQTVMKKIRNLRDGFNVGTTGVKYEF